MRLKCISLIIGYFLLTLPCTVQSATSLQDLSSELTKLINNASPAIVEIRAVKYGTINDFLSYEDLPENVGEAVERAMPTMALRPSVGSGFIFNTNGFIMTTGQVVSDAKNITVRFLDGTEIKAKLIAIDPLTDAAVLKIDKTGLKALEFGNSDQLEPGSIVVSINDMAGMINSASLGIVSGVGRRIGWNGLDLIQISGTIGPGASGGPVLDPSGKVVGMTAAMFAPSPAAFQFNVPSVSITTSNGNNDSTESEDNIRNSDLANMNAKLNEIVRAITIQANEAARITSSSGFAIPINKIKPVIAELKSGKEIKRSYLGASISQVDGQIILITEPGGPAEKAGVKSGDVLIKADGQVFKQTAEFAGYIVGKRPGDVIAMVLNREGKEIKVKVTLSQRPQPQINTTDQKIGDAQRISIGIGRSNDGETQISIDLENVTPLQVAQAISNAYGKDVTISDPNQIKKKITLSIKSPTIEKALDSVCQAMDCKYIKDGDSYIISPK
jgi:S1-C subfamily serine protease